MARTFRLRVGGGEAGRSSEVVLDHDLELLELGSNLAGTGPYVLQVERRAVRLERQELAAIIAAARELLEVTK